MRASSHLFLRLAFEADWPTEGINMSDSTVRAPVTSLTVRSTRTPRQAMASPFLWPAVVPSALRAPAPVN